MSLHNNVYKEYLRLSLCLARLNMLNALRIGTDGEKITQDGIDAVVKKLIDLAETIRDLDEEEREILIQENTMLFNSMNEELYNKEVSLDDLEE